MVTLVAVGGTTHTWSAEVNGTGYALSEGQRYSTCRDYLQNIRFLGLSHTVALEWPVSSQSKNIRKPRWQAVDASTRLDIIEHIYRARRDGTLGANPLTDDDTAKAWDRIKPSVLSEITSGVARLERTQVDFNNDGRQEEAFRYGRKAYPVGGKLKSSTGEATLFGWWYWFVGEDGYAEQSWRTSGASWSFKYDLFLHKGRTYISAYGTDSYLIGKIPDLHIFEPKSVRTSELAMIPVCRFSYPAE